VGFGLFAPWGRPYEHQILDARILQYPRHGADISRRRRFNQNDPDIGQRLSRNKISSLSHALSFTISVCRHVAQSKDVEIARNKICRKGPGFLAILS
jgi:hypothetical protein